MKAEVQRWQEDGHAAFKWLASMYEQAQTLWDDAQRYFLEAEWTPNASGGFGGSAMSQADMAEWPFIYLKALAATPKEPFEVMPWTFPIFGIYFYDEQRVGPVVYAGTFRWHKKPRRGHWAIYHAFCRYKGRFEVASTAGEAFNRALPTAAGTNKYPGIEEIRWFEVPLGGVASAAQLKSIVTAAIEMADGEDDAARRVVAEHASG